LSQSECGARSGAPAENGRDYNPKRGFRGEFPTQILRIYRQAWQLGVPYDKLAIEIIYH